MQIRTFTATLTAPFLLTAGLALSTSSQALQCDYTINGDWGTGFNGRITVTNNSPDPIKQWHVGWSHGAVITIEDIWNAKLKDGTTFVASNTDWNGRLAAGATTSFGFTAIGTQASASIESCTESATDDGQPPAETIGSVALTAKMGAGWNAGNSLDAVGGETAWGNPRLTQNLFDAVKAAGFDTVRLPVAWSQFADDSNFIITDSWLARVEEVVNYALDADLYVMINMHWDGGWMQPTYDQQEYVTKRMSKMWQQIANRFADYDHNLLFAGTNEVMVTGDYGTPTPEYYTVQNGYNQTFVDTVRATGGKNANRFLVVQGFNTHIDHTVNFAIVPNDSAEDRLLMEVHYYDPYFFTLAPESNLTQWGAIATDPDKTEAWANETYLDSQFQKMKARFVDQGIGVILGEFGVISRLDIEDHEIYRTYWNKYVAESAFAHQMVPVYWDNGYSGDGGLAIFNRATGAQLYPDIINAIVNAAP